MYKTLNPWAIGVQGGTLQERIGMAKQHGFAGIEVSADEVATLVEQQGAEAVRELFTEANIVPAAFGLPTDWRTSEENWRQGLAELPRLAASASAIGCHRTMTWILSCSNDRPYEENFRFHVERFTPIAQILADHGIALGLEYLGPKTLRESQKHLFIHTMQPMIEMGVEIGTNVGLLLDCWHWHTSGGTCEELLTLRPEQVVYVHVNDAPAGVAMEDYVDNVRGLPGETGVIDIAGFLTALNTVGYDGPVTAEPFQKNLTDLPDDEARLQTVSQAMDTILRHLL